MNKNTYTVSPTKQLIDLNGSSVNFEIDFKVTSKNGEPFELLVVDQTTLDNSPNLSYRQVQNGKMSGRLVNDKNVYQNYFLVLKAESPCECTVEISKTEIQPKPMPPKQTESYKGKTKGNKVSWVKILLVVGAVALGGYLLYMLSKKKSKESKPSFGMGDDRPRPTGHRPRLERPRPTGHRPRLERSEHRPRPARPEPRPIAASSPSLSPMASPENPLIQRLKNMKLY